MVRTKVLTILLSLILVLLSLYNVHKIPGVYALTDTGGGELRLLNIVNVTLTGDGPVYSIKFVNVTLTLNSSGCPCCSSSNSSISELNSSYTVLLNETDDEHTLMFTHIHISGTINNTEINYTFYLLLYQSIKEEYNATVITTIFTDPTNQSKFIFFKTIANIQPTPDKAIQIMDTINIMNRTTLSEHYKILSKTLKYLGEKEEATEWIWAKLGNELNKLSKIVEHKLKEYDSEGAYSISFLIDDYWSCLLEKFFECAHIGDIGVAICALGCGIACMSSLIGFFPCFWLCAEICDWYDIAMLAGCAFYAIISC